MSELRTVLLTSIDIAAQPRVDFRAIEALAQSIASVGLLQPPVVIPTAGERFRLLVGERRVRAVKLLQDRQQWGETIPVLVLPSSDLAGELQANLSENTARLDLRPWEAGAGIAQLRKLGASMKTIAFALGKTVGWVTQHAAIADGMTPEARALLAQLPPDQTHVRRCLELARMLDEHGEPGAEKQIAWIRSGFAKGRPLSGTRGRYERTFERRRTIQRIALMRAAVLPQLRPEQRGAIEAALAFLESPGEITAFNQWERLT